MLHQSVNRIKTKSQKDLEANSYVCRSYRGKTARGHFCPSIPDMVKLEAKKLHYKIYKNIYKNDNKVWIYKKVLFPKI